MKKTIYLCIEIKVRELLPKIYLSYLAAKNNYRIYLGSREEIFNLIINKKSKGGIFFYKAGLQNKIFEKIDSKTDHHVVLDEEIAPGFTNAQYKNRVLSFHRKTVDRISNFFYLNKEISNIVKKQYPKIIKKKIISSGWPRFDILSKKYLKIFKKKVDLIKKNEKKFYLFVSDFGYISKNYEVFANEYHPWGVKKDQIKKVKKLQVDEAKFTFEDFQKVTSFLIKYMRNNKSQKIIIRAHPTDSIVIWKKLLQGIKNVKLVKPTDDIIPWILASSGVLHRGCTTSIQSKLLGKKVGYINLGSHNKKNKFFKEFLYSISSPIKGKKDLDKWLLDESGKENQNFIQKKFKLMNIITNRESGHVIIETLNKLLVKKENKILLKSENNIFYSKIILYRSIVLRKILILFNKLKIINKNMDRFDFTPKITNGINSNEVNYYLKLFRKKNSKISAKKINQELVVIE